MDNEYRGLPTETVLQIMSTLHRERQYAALKSCSLASRVFRILAQMHLFREVVLKCGSIFARSNPIALFTSSLHASPQIATYVHKLTIDVSGRDGSDGSASSLAKLLPRLTGLRILTVGADHEEIDRRFIRWADCVSERTMLAALASITDLDLTGFGCVPAYVLRHCTALKRLSIAFIAYIVDKPRVPCKPLCQLDYLHLTLVSRTALDETVEWLSTRGCPLDVSRVQTLSYRTESKHHIERIDALAPLLSSVTNLRLYAQFCVLGTPRNTLNYTLDPAQEPVPKLERFVNLRALTLDATLRACMRGMEFANPLPWIAAALSSTLPALTRIRLNLAFTGFQAEQLRLLHANWILLAQALEKQPHFEHLELRITGLSDDEVAVLRADECLADMEAEGRLEYISDLSLKAGMAGQ